MPHRQQLHYNVIVRRHNSVVHIQDAASLQDAELLVLKFEAVAGNDVEIQEVHGAADTDLTTHTREILEDLRET